MRPENALPVPVDDGACDHLVGMTAPAFALPATVGPDIDLSTLRGRAVVYAYPRTGPPGQAELADDWDMIAGARGCTEEACSFRDHHAELAALGVQVFGLNTQPTAEQLELVERTHLPFPLLSDVDLSLTRALKLPTFEVAGVVLLKRHTLIVCDGRIEHVFYPVFPPDTHGDEVGAWLKARR